MFFDQNRTFVILSSITQTRQCIKLIPIQSLPTNSRHGVNLTQKVPINCRIAPPPHSTESCKTLNLWTSSGRLNRNRYIKDDLRLFFTVSQDAIHVIADLENQNIPSLGWAYDSDSPRPRKVNSETADLSHSPFPRAIKRRY